MNFARWFEGQQDTANKFKNLLQNVPQEPEHHPEGDVLAHTRLVRGSIQKAIGAMKIVQSEMPVLANLNFDVNPEEFEILAMAAWLHDIGKHTATQTQLGKITAYGHQDSKHFMPQIEKFKDIATPETQQLYLKNKELIDFLIQHHMDLMSKSGFSKGFRAEWMDDEGKLKNDSHIKLLIILMMADKMGRGTKSGETPQDVHQKAISFNQSGLQTTYDKALKRLQTIATHDSKPFEGDIQSFIDMLRDKGVPENIIKANVKKKFG